MCYTYNFLRTMISCIFLKPESIWREQDIIEGINLINWHIKNLETQRIINTIISSVSVLLKGVQFSEDCLYAEEWELTEEMLFEVMYPTLLWNQEIITKMKQQYVGRKYKIVFFNIDTQKDETEIFWTLQQLKWKMSELGPMYSTWLRGHMYRKSLEEKEKNESENNSWNFVHIPDTEEEVLQLLDYTFNRSNQDQQNQSFNVIKNTKNATNIFLSRQRQQSLQAVGGIDITSFTPEYELEVAMQY